MTHLTTEQLQAIQAKADSMLEVIIESLEGSTELQSGTSCGPVMTHCPSFSNCLLTNRL